MLPKYKRKKFFINPSFQLRFLAFTGIIAFTMILISYLANVYFFHKFIQLGLSFSLRPDHIVFQYLRMQQSTMAVLFIGLSLLNILILSTFGLVFSHRISGFLFKFRNHLNKDTDTGRLTPVTFRKNDFFTDLAIAYNELGSKLEGEKNTIKK